MGALVSRSDKRVPAFAILFGQSKETWAVEPHLELISWNLIGMLVGTTWHNNQLSYLALSFAKGLIGYLIGMLVGTTWHNNQLSYLALSFAQGLIGYLIGMLQSLQKQDNQLHTPQTYSTYSLYDKPCDQLREQVGPLLSYTLYPYK